MAVDESFKRPGTVPFKWEVQPGIPKQQQGPACAAGDVVPPANTPRLALPPAARVVGAPLSCRRASSSVALAAASAAPLSPPAQAPQTTSHRRSMSARFATSLALMPIPFTRRGRGGGGGRASAAKDADADFCLLYAADKIV